MSLFKGACTALVTPFFHGKPDYEALENLIEFQIKNQIDAIVSCGTTGEASTLSDQEVVDVVKFTYEKVNGRVPVIAGAGSNDTAHAIEMGKELSHIGIDGLLFVTPYYNKCSDRGLIQHYTTIANEMSLPMIVYSVQGRTGVNISPSVVSVISRHPNICGIKEASGNIAQVVEISKYCSENFALYSGNDESTVPLLSMGGSGVITTVGNIIPYEMHKMVLDYLSGDIREAMLAQREYKALIDAVFAEVNPIPIKAALSIMKKIHMEYRLPLCEPSQQTIERLNQTLADYGLFG